jgi:hypothetical protein
MLNYMQGKPERATPTLGSYEYNNWDCNYSLSL